MASPPAAQIDTERAAVSSPTASSPTASSPAASSPVLSPAATSAPSSESTLASRQAAAVNNLLSSSATTLKALHGAVNQVSNCTNLSTAVSQIRSAVNQRSSENNQASALSTSALAIGRQCRVDLIAATCASLDADKDFLTWAQQQLNPGCTPTAQSSAYNAAYNASQQAGGFKVRSIHCLGSHRGPIRCPAEVARQHLAASQPGRPGTAS